MLNLRELFHIANNIVKNRSSIKAIYQKLTKNMKILNNRKIGIRKKKYPQEKGITDDCLKKLNQGTPFIAGKIGGAELMALEYEDHWLKLSLIKNGAGRGLPND